MAQSTRMELKGIVFDLLLFIQNLCEGHNIRPQLFLQTQPLCRFDIDLVVEICELAKFKFELLQRDVVQLQCPRLKQKLNLFYPTSNIN